MIEVRNEDKLLFGENECVIGYRWNGEEVSVEEYEKFFRNYMIEIKYGYQEMT